MPQSHALGRAIGAADLAVIVGGASVGDYDIVKQALLPGVSTFRCRQSRCPGKPTWFRHRRRLSHSWPSGIRPPPSFARAFLPTRPRLSRAAAAAPWARAVLTAMSTRTARTSLSAGVGGRTAGAERAPIRQSDTPRVHVAAATRCCAAGASGAGATAERVDVPAARPGAPIRDQAATPAPQVHAERAYGGALCGCSGGLRKPHSC